MTLQPVWFTPLWLASWVAAVVRSRSSRSSEVQDVWQMYGGQLQCVSAADAKVIERSLGSRDVHSAWLSWSWAVESALVRVFVDSGGPVPGRGWFVAGGKLGSVGCSWRS